MKKQNEEPRKEQNEEQPSKGMRVYRVLRFILIPVILIVIGYSAYRMISIFTEYRQSEVAYEAITNEFLIAPRTPHPDDVPYVPGEPGQAQPYDPSASADPSPVKYWSNT